MKSKRFVFRDIEWWVITFVFLLIVLFNILAGGRSMESFFGRVLVPIVLYLGFYLMHLKVIPQYLEDKKVGFLVLYSILIAVAAGVFTGVLSAVNDMDLPDFLRIYFNSLALYMVYLITSTLLRSMLLPPKLHDFQLYNGARILMIFIFTTVFLFNAQPIVNEGVIVVYSLIIPIILLLVLYNYQFIYGNRLQGKINASRWFTWGLILVVVVATVIIAIALNTPEFLLVNGIAVLIVFLIIFPISNALFQKYKNYVGKIDTLSYQVGQSSANLSFLRSQINPHFLFNALNTLYGTALMENAEKTSDGIQKLGDMMRFMLHENQMDKIPLSREIDYLKNYLDLQMLRFRNEENLDVKIQMNTDFCEGSIAPMLLIPFVENAFKHGISTKSKSWIKINLRCIQGSVHLDVVNSIHPKKASEDPKDESGIGLGNVKDRLNMQYANRHQLTITSNDEEHFVHFSVQI